MGQVAWPPTPLYSSVWVFLCSLPLGKNNHATIAFPRWFHCWEVSWTPSCDMLNQRIVLTHVLFLNNTITPKCLWNLETTIKTYNELAEGGLAINSFQMTKPVTLLALADLSPQSNGTSTASTTRIVQRQNWKQLQICGKRWHSPLPRQVILVFPIKIKWCH